MEFQSFNMIFFIVFGLIAFVMIMGIVKTIGAGLSNQAAERVQRSCKVVDKRTRVRGGSGDFSASTYYYITFEFDGGEAYGAGGEGYCKSNGSIKVLAGS
ncbi:DUF2500 domain-containing protein [Paenibacillus peoriae]|uniref:DUF2500 domain-containing protein n=1 Tax=Paenibacillus peoriae TaxID=59893 RepID=UPI001CC21ECF|nr:DUF2500 domain-containing protein [Paenibacillus peoriae]